MTNQPNKTKINILYAVLNWGLGHATRSIPLIRTLMKNELLNSEFHITIVSTGRALNLLKSEFPMLDFIDMPDYNIKYSKKGIYLIPYLAIQIPSIVYKIFLEHREIKNIVKSRNIDIVISDSRYGVFSSNKNVTNYFITHQLRFKLPPIISFLEIFSEFFNRFIFSFYDKIFVMDNKGKPNISGDLSHKNNFINMNKVKFIGLFSDTLKESFKDIESNFIARLNSNIENIDKNDVNTKLYKFLFTNSDNESKVTKNKTVEKCDLRYLVIISGVETQRSLFESKILSQIGKLKGKKIIILGLTEIEESFSKKTIEYNNSEILIFNHLPREIISDLINLTDFIICRSGYSSVMDLVYLKKKALLIPTPGQTEQEYLATYYKNEKLFYSVSQKLLDLERDSKIAYDFSNTLNENIGIENYNSAIPINEVNLFLDEISKRNPH